MAHHRGERRGAPRAVRPVRDLERGLPIGVQLIARAKAEDSLFAAAEILRPSGDELPRPAVPRR